MAYLNIERVLALPQVIRPSTMYVVRATDNGLVELYFSNNDGTEVRHVINKSEIQSLINQYVVNATSSLSDVKIVANIASRNALTLTANGLCLVLDATADSTVSSGAALYIYDYSESTWSKVAEYESLDVELLWGSIQGKPTSSVAAIDDAVSKAHVHTNKALLDKISVDGDGEFIYDGKFPKAALDVNQW